MRALRASVFAGLLILAMSSGLLADPCLVVYPDAPCIYQYDPSEYFTVGPGDPLYDAQYDRGGLVLLETGSGQIDLSIYQAPHITGFMATYDGNDGISSAARPSLSSSTASRMGRRPIRTFS